MEVLLIELLLYIQKNFIDILFGVILIISTLVLFSILNDRNNIEKNDFIDVPANKSESKFFGKTVTFETMQ